MIYCNPSFLKINTMRFLQDWFLKISAHWNITHCWLCETPSPHIICEQCNAELPRPPLVCPRCAHALVSVEQVQLCENCRFRPPSFDYVKAVFQYQYPIDKIIQAMKYQAHFVLQRWLALQMQARLQTTVEKFKETPLLVPVPAYPTDLGRRGYNQAAELTKYLARAFNLPYDFNKVVCIKPKQRQANLSQRQRQQNVQGVFAVRPILQHYSQIIIVDDVVTTGATVNEIASQLKLAGVEKVGVWCCARR